MRPFCSLVSCLAKPKLTNKERPANTETAHVDTLVEVVGTLADLAEGLLVALREAGRHVALEVSSVLYRSMGGERRGFLARGASKGAKSLDLNGLQTAVRHAIKLSPEPNPQKHPSSKATHLDALLLPLLVDNELVVRVRGLVRLYGGLDILLRWRQ